MKTTQEIMAGFDQAIKDLKEWVEGKPIEDTPEWVKVFDEKYGSFQLCEPINKKDYDRLKEFIRHEVLEKFIDDLKSSSADGERMRCVGFSDIDAVLKRWMGGI